MKKTTEPSRTANIVPLLAFANAIHADLKRALQPLRALRAGWHHNGVSGAWHAFWRALRENVPQGLFSLLLIAQGLVLALLLVAIVVAVAVDGVLAWTGLAR